MEAFWAAQIIVLKAMSPGEGSVELVLDDPTGPEHLGVGEDCVGTRRARGILEAVGADQDVAFVVDKW